MASIATRSVGVVAGCLNSMVHSIGPAVFDSSVITAQVVVEESARDELLGRQIEESSTIHDEVST